MKRLIKNGDVILDGTLTYIEKTKEAFKKLEEIEELLDSYEIGSLLELKMILFHYDQIRGIRDYCERDKKRKEELLKNDKKDN